MNLHPTITDRAEAADLLSHATTTALADLHAAECLRATLPSLIAALEGGKDEEATVASLVRWLVAVDSARAGRIGELEKVAVTFDGPARIARAA